MNEFEIKIMGLYTRIDKTHRLSKQLKTLAGVCVFFSICYCLGTMSIENIKKSQVILTNLVWLISIVALAVIYVKDSERIKNSKECELEIYRLKSDDLKCKKEIARIKGEVLPDHIENTKIEMPDENVVLPKVYYGVLLGIDIIMRIIVSI